MNLLLIEDDQTYAWLVREMLVEAFPGQDVELAAFASVRAATAEPRAFDCALVDMSVSDASGIAVLDAVIAAMPEMPLIVLTGAEDENLALQAVERGAQDYLVKRRVDPEVLGRSVRYAIERKRSEAQRAELLRARAAHAEAAALSGMLERLQQVSDAAIPVHGELDRDELLERSLAIVAAEAGALIVSGSGGGTVAACRNLDNMVVSHWLEDHGVTGQMLATRAPLVLDDVAAQTSADDPFAGVESLLAVPLEADGRRLGILVAASALPGRFSDEQSRMLMLAGERAARGLASAAAYERERRTASALQAGLLPQGVPTLRHGQLAVRYLPAHGAMAIGGDWYDAIVLPDGRVGLAVGDVTGHGPEAAILMGQLRTALRAYALEGGSPATVVSRLNALTLSLADEAMATLVYAVLDANLSSGSYVNAGHPAPIRVSANGAEQLGSRTSPPAGASDASEFVEHELTLEPGDAFCLYSDGLVEERGTEFRVREQALLEALGTPAAAEVMCERALAALRPQGAVDDDVALLVLQTTEAPDGRLRASHPATADSLGEARAELRQWLESIGASRAEISEMQLAANEACMNVVEHAYDEGASKSFEIEGHLDGRTVVLIVRDSGRWSEVQSRGRGRGLKLMEAVMDSVQISFSSTGTVVVLRRALEAARAA